MMSKISSSPGAAATKQYTQNALYESIKETSTHTLNSSMISYIHESYESSDSPILL